MGSASLYLPPETSALTRAASVSTRAIRVRAAAPPGRPRARPRRAAGAPAPAGGRGARAGARRAAQPERARTGDDGGEQRVHRRIAPDSVGLHAAQEDTTQPAGHAAVLAGRADLAEAHRRGQLAQRLAGEGALAVEGLVEGHAVAELVGAGVDGAAPVLLGRHVGGRADQRARLGQVSGPALAVGGAAHGLALLDQ